jgi:hypothetical protein
LEAVSALYPQLLLAYEALFEPNIVDFKPEMPGFRTLGKYTPIKSRPSMPSNKDSENEYCSIPPKPENFVALRPQANLLL